MAQAQKRWSTSLTVEHWDFGDRVWFQHYLLCILCVGTDLHGVLAEHQQWELRSITSAKCCNLPLDLDLHQFWRKDVHRSKQLRSQMLGDVGLMLVVGQTSLSLVDRTNAEVE